MTIAPDDDRSMLGSSHAVEFAGNDQVCSDHNDPEKRLVPAEPTPAAEPIPATASA